jgi:hypothetical protein
VKLTTHLQLVPRSRKRGSILPPPIRFHGVMLNYLNTGINLPLILFSHLILGFPNGLFSLVIRLKFCMHFFSSLLCRATYRGICPTIIYIYICVCVCVCVCKLYFATELNSSNYLSKQNCQIIKKLVSL